MLSFTTTMDLLVKWKSKETETETRATTVDERQVESVQRAEAETKTLNI